MGAAQHGRSGQFGLVRRRGVGGAAQRWQQCGIAAYRLESCWFLMEPSVLRGGARTAPEREVVRRHRGAFPTERRIVPRRASRVVAEATDGMLRREEARTAEREFCEEVQRKYSYTRWGVKPAAGGRRRSSLLMRAGRRRSSTVTLAGGLGTTIASETEQWGRRKLPESAPLL